MNKHGEKCWTATENAYECSNKVKQLFRGEVRSEKTHQQNTEKEQVHILGFFYISLHFSSEINLVLTPKEERGVLSICFICKCFHLFWGNTKQNLS